MKKIILTTIAYTVAALWLVIFLTMSIWSLAAPKTASNFFLKMGFNRISGICACMQYERTKEIQDLGCAVERSIKSDNDVKVVLYAEKMIHDPEFNNYAEFKDEQLKDKMDLETDYNYANYIYSNLVESLFDLGRHTAAISIAMTKVGFNYPYSTTNPLRKIITLCVESEENFTQELIEADKYLKMKLERDVKVNVDGKYDKSIKTICEDGKIVAQKLGDTTAMQKYTEELNKVLEKEA